MRRTIAVLLALLLGLSLLAACGKEKDPEVPAQARGSLLEDTCLTCDEAGDWVFYERSSGLTLKLGGIESKVEMELNAYTRATPEERIESQLNWYDNSVQAEENVTYNGIEYFVIEKADGKGFVLVSNKGEGDLCALQIDIKGTTLEQAAPVLDTVKLRGEEAEIKHEFPETEAVELKHLTYTAKGGWYLYDKFDRPYNSATKGKLKNDKLRPNATYMEIKEGSRSPQYEIEDDYGIRFLNKEAVRKDNVTINGIEWLVMEDAQWNKTFLVTSWRPGLLMDQDGNITVEIRDVDIDGAMPVLETIKLVAEY